LSAGWPFRAATVVALCLLMMGAAASGSGPAGTRLMTEMTLALDALARAQAALDRAKTALTGAERTQAEIAGSGNQQARDIAGQAVAVATAARNTAQADFSRRQREVDALCARARSQFAQDRQAVDRQTANTQTFLKSLKEWEDANDKAMTDAFVSAATIFLGRYGQHLIERAQRRERWRKFFVGSQKMLGHKGVDVKLVLYQLDRHAVSYDKAQSLIKQAKVLRAGLTLKNAYTVLKSTFEATSSAIAEADGELLKAVRSTAILETLREQSPDEDFRLIILEAGLEQAAGALPPLYNPVALAKFGYNAAAFNESRKRLLQRYEFSDLEPLAADALRHQLENTMAVVKKCRP